MKRGRAGVRRATAGLVVLACALQGPAAAIVGGQPGGGGEASAVMVLTDRGGICSGVVLARDVVLTAAHCVPAGAQIRVHFREQGQPVLMETAAISRHPEFRANAVAERTRSIDLALIRTRTPLPARFSEAPLATWPATGEGSLRLSGFGLSVEGDAATTGTWRSVVVPLTEPYGPSRVLYWLGNRASAGACQGDSGGPAFDAQSRVTGIISWSTGTGAGKRCGNLTQAVILGPQRGWIDATLAGWSRQASWN